MKNILFITFCLIVVMILISANQKYGGQDRIHAHHVTMPAGIFKVPGDLGNYRSSQISLQDLEAALRKGVIRTVIRLNSNGKDSGGVAAQAEKALCKKFNVAFVLINTGKPGAAVAANGLLMNGRCLIHCLDGFGRTGAMVGYHLRQIGYSRDEVLAHNAWTGKKMDGNFTRYFKMIE